MRLSYSDDTAQHLFNYQQFLNTDFFLLLLPLKHRVCVVMRMGNIKQEKETFHFYFLIQNDNREKLCDLQHRTLRLSWNGNDGAMCFKHC